MNNSSNIDHSKVFLDAVKLFPTTPREIGSSLAPINCIELSIHQQPLRQWSLIVLGSELDEECDNSNNINYYSDGNRPIKAALMDNYDEEHYLIDNIDDDDDDPEELETDDIIFWMMM